MANHGKRGWVKWLVMLAVAGGAVAGGAAYFQRQKLNREPEYQTATIVRSEITQAVTATGQLNPVLNVQVGSQISGIIQKLNADFNSRVKAGEVIAQLDAATYQANVNSAEGDLANANAGLELAQVNARRAEELFKSKLIAQSEYDQSVATLHQAEAQVKIRTAALERAKVDLGRCTIYAPVDGIVISRNVDVGQTVAASMNAPTLFIIANDLAKMQINANVSEADVGTVEEGQRVNFTVDAFPDRTFTGQVTQIRNSPTTVQNVVTYDAVIGVSNPDLKLKPGMTANVSIITAQHSGVLKIPNGALRFKPPEPSTNQAFAARWLAKIGLGKGTKTAATNEGQVTPAGDTNKIQEVASAAPPLTGNEPPEELLRRVREMRERGEEPPPEIRAKLRELFQSGTLPRSVGSGVGGSGSRSRATQPASRTVYVLATHATAGGESALTPQPVRVKTGISDGTFTEVTDGLREGDTIITGIKQSSAPVLAPAGTSPFGGGGSFRRGP